ncbi:Uncharacterised protein [uncultured archaeon]|nr:Uncharacterised protein [uncultured archaeon]
MNINAMAKPKIAFAAALSVMILLQGCLQAGVDGKGVVVANDLVKVSGRGEATAGEEITVEAQSLEQSTRKLTILFGFGKKSIECSGPCSFAEKFRPSEGIYPLEARAETAKGILSSGIEKITVKKQGKNCVDGTAFGACSGKKPLFCVAGKLDENCEKCGCGQEETCIGTKCVSESAMRDSDSDAMGQNRGDGNATGGIAGQEGNYGGQNDASNAAPPERPSLLGAFVEGDDVVLSWAKVEGAAECRIYVSSGANPAFIQYTLAKTVPGTETSAAIQSLAGGKHFFVMTCTGVNGKESKFSAVKEAEVT